MDNDIKKPVRFEAGKKLTKEEKKEVYKELKDSYRVNLRPHTVENDKIVWLFEASDYMTKSDITGRLLRWYIYLPDGRIAHPTEVFGASMPVSEVKRVQNNIEYNERQSDIKYNEVVKLLKERGEIQKVINGIETALNNGAKFEKEFDSNDIGKKNPFVWLKFVIGANLSVPQYIIKNLDEVYLGIDKDEFIKIKVEGLRNKYVNGSLSDIDWERFYNEFKETENNDMETEIKEYRYNLTARPFSIGTYPSESKFGFLRFEENDRFGTVIYSKKLPLEKVKNYELSPITDIFIYDGKKMLFHNKFPAKIEVKVNERNRSYVSIIPEKEGVKNIQLGSIDFLEELENGKHTIIDDSEAKETEKPKIGNVFGDLVLDKLEKAYKQKFPNDKFEREALIKSWNETKNERGNTNRANENLADIYLSYFNSDLRAKIYSDLINEAKELEKGIAVENKIIISGLEIPKEIDDLFKKQSELDYYRSYYGSKLNSFPKDEMGLTLNSVKSTQEYKDIKQKSDLSKIKSDNFNASKEGKELQKFYSNIKDRVVRLDVSKHYRNLSEQLEKGIAVEQEHLKTFEKVASGDITPEQAIVETAQEHISENPAYYDELEKIEKPKIEQWNKQN